MTARQPLDEPLTPVIKQPLPKREADKGYKRERSFIDFLPWVEYLDDHDAVQAGHTPGTGGRER